MTSVFFTQQVCLDEPMTCGQVTLCGHAFCFPCIARHTVSDRKEGEPAKCPMCFTPLRLADLRTVRRRPIDPMDGKDASPIAKAKRLMTKTKATKTDVKRTEASRV